MPFQNRLMTLVAFLQAQNCCNLFRSWRRGCREFLRAGMCARKGRNARRRY
jgi:hypothetical protein